MRNLASAQRRWRTFHGAWLIVAACGRTSNGAVVPLVHAPSPLTTQSPADADADAGASAPNAAADAASVPTAPIATSVPTAATVATKPACADAARCVRFVTKVSREKHFCGGDVAIVAIVTNLCKKPLVCQTRIGDDTPFGADVPPGATEKQISFQCNHEESARYIHRCTTATQEDVDVGRCEIRWRDPDG
jgi:hypothetical protein